MEVPVLGNAGANEDVSPGPIAITPGSDAMMRFWVCWLNAWGFCSRLCKAVRVLTGGREPPGTEICAWTRERYENATCKACKKDVQVQF